MKTLVTGAAGFIGGHLIALLLKKNHEVIGIANWPDRRAACNAVISLARITLVRPID